MVRTTCSRECGVAWCGSCRACSRGCSRGRRCGRHITVHIPWGCVRWRLAREPRLRSCPDKLLVLVTLTRLGERPLRKRSLSKTPFAKPFAMGVPSLCLALTTVVNDFAYYSSFSAKINGIQDALLTSLHRWQHICDRLHLFGESMLASNHFSPTSVAAWGAAPVAASWDSGSGRWSAVPLGAAVPVARSLAAMACQAAGRLVTMGSVPVRSS